MQFLFLLGVDLDYCIAHIQLTPNNSLCVSSLDSVVTMLTTFFLLPIKHEKRIYLCCKNIVYDVTSARDFYGPEGPYANFAGRDASRALALMSLKIEDVENTDLSDLNEEQLNVLNDWERKFKSKYKIVGRYQA